ncbi:MAG TPA: multidrug ABC transporter ATP-binding protein, partial [Clostridiales bacterium]|nr:multidrug ABC transporter ATP-binding protein [Clostridiales bacterium]
MTGEKARDFKGTFRKLLRFLRPYRLSLFVVLIFSVASTVFMVIGPKLMGRATTRLFEGVVSKLSQVPGAAIDFAYIGQIIIWLIAIYVASSIFNFIQGFIMSGISMKISYRFRQDISTKIGRMPLRYFDNQTHGDVLSRVTNDVDTVSQSLNQGLAQLVSMVTAIVGALVMMLSIS